MTRRNGNTTSGLLILLSCLMAIMVPAESHAAPTTIRVANDGVDTENCGTAVAPCRSLSQGIQNATDGDIVLVGPGRYGDLNGNGIFGEPGEEAGLGPCFCLIDVNKRLTIRSEMGALQTVLDGAGTARRMVAISASFVTFGARGRGFTVTGSTRAGLAIIADEGVIVSGNFATENRVGNDFGEGFTVIRGRNHRFLANVATGNGGGFSFFGESLIATNNVAVANFGGGFGGEGSNYLLRRNVSSGNQAGFGFAGPGHRMQFNAAIGNRFFGIVVQRAQPENPPTAGFFAERNNIYGNGTGISSPPPNCGFFNTSQSSVKATHNYWGSALGPGPDPADFACELDGAIASRPFSPVEFPVLDAAGADCPLGSCVGLPR